MSYDIVKFTPGSDVANAGTITINYPTNHSKGDYGITSNDHTLFVDQNGYVCPISFTLAFNANASNITLTNNTGATIKAGVPCMLQLERIGQDAGTKLILPTAPGGVQNLRAQQMMPVSLELGSPNTASSNAGCLSQSVAAAGSFVLNGTLAAANASGVTVITFDVPRNIVAAWTTTSVLTFTGTDEYGVVMHENSASGASHTGKKAFKTITSITSTASITAATVGTGEKLGLPIALRKAGQILAEMQDAQTIGKGSPEVQRIYFYYDQAKLIANKPVQIESPITGFISKLAVTVDTTITTGGTVGVNVAATPVVGLTVTVANSDVAGTEYTSTVANIATSVVAKASKLSIIPASFATAGAIDGYIEITPTDDTRVGTFVAADGAKPTATTGDVRGTYTPLNTSDGTTGARLLVLTADPSDIGATQF